MFCTKCGEPIPENCGFCPVCGEKQKMTGETEKDAKAVAGTILKKTAEGMKLIVGPLVVIAGQTLLDDAGKVVKKKTGKATNNVLKKMGLKKKTPLDTAKDVLKKVRK